MLRSADEGVLNEPVVLGVSVFKHVKHYRLELLGEVGIMVLLLGLV